MKQIQYTPDLIERFYSKISKIPTEQGCLEWMAYHDAFGHGYFGIGNGRTERTHRIAWALVNGPIPAGLVIRHMCNNPLCCNVAHLLLGTRADNNRDMAASGRWKNAPNDRAPYVRPVGPTAVERFYANISSTPNETGCLDWLGHLTNKGYGYLGAYGKKALAHRFAWELVNGPIPPGMYACHVCDRPICCNHLHIFIGTNADNLRDMREKGRGGVPPHLSGEKTGMSKLTTAQVKEIRSPQYENWSAKDIAARFGVTNVNICDILNRHTWKHLDSSGDAPILDRSTKGERNGMTKLTEADVLEIRNGEKFSGWTQEEIGKHFGVSDGVISSVRLRTTWKHI